ncbi:DUF6973 domain-containing protein [Nocardia camponoti]|uniref:DUF6973 domain-containing protein n=1 Tax=Nocardia camponoti TaxID=1616106 RepID=A0A917QI08_9NOCA|nr:hypothetical protein [Nocardia camponoti]GGK49915.1 hypothetical protein GCM10011591_21790 [Nocardia camponoti]
MPEPLTVPVVLAWETNYLSDCVGIMLETAKAIDTEAIAAAGKVERSTAYFASEAGNTSRQRGAADKIDTLKSADVLEALATSLRTYVAEFDSNIKIIREQKKEAEESVWDLYVTDDGQVKSRKSNWETGLEYGSFGAGAIAAKEFWMTRYQNLISAALTWIKRVDQEGAEIYVKNLEGLTDQVKTSVTTTPNDPELARILREYQTDASKDAPRLWPVGAVADALKAIGVNQSPSLLTAEEIAAMEKLYATHGIGAVGQALTLPDVANAAADEYSRGTRADGQGDAYRHMYWNAMMTQKFGEDWAQTYATAHEKSAANDPQREAMDLWNNELGRKIGAANPNASPEELQALVRQEVESGRAVVITAKDTNGDPLPAEQTQITWSRSTDQKVTGPPAGVGIPLPGRK